MNSLDPFNSNNSNNLNDIGNFEKDSRLDSTANASEAIGGVSEIDKRPFQIAMSKNWAPRQHSAQREAAMAQERPTSIRVYADRDTRPNPALAAQERMAQSFRNAAATRVMIDQASSLYTQRFVNATRGSGALPAPVSRFQPRMPMGRSGYYSSRQTPGPSSVGRSARTFGSMRSSGSFDR